MTDYKHGEELQEPWQNPIPLPELSPVEPFTPEMLPESLRMPVIDASERMQCPPDFIAASTIVAISSVVGCACGIHPKAHDDWIEYPNLWGCIIGSPSAMKSPAIGEAFRYIRTLEDKAAAIFRADHKRFKGEKYRYDIRVKASQDKAKKAAERGEELSAMPEFDEPSEPVQKRFLTQDGTIEKIGMILVGNPRGILVCRDELIGFLRDMDKPGHEGNRAFYLESWNAREGYCVDRVGRGTLYIPRLSLSIFGAATPGPISTYVMSAKSNGVGNDGLLQRFQVAVYPDPPPLWRYVDRKPNTHAREKLDGIFTTLASDDFYSDISGDPRALHFDHEAQDLAIQWLEDLESRLRIGNLPPIMESYLAKQRKTIPCIALSFHLIEMAEGKASGPVSARSLQRAIAWGKYLESHAARIYRCVVIPEMLSARLLLGHIQKGKIKNAQTIREIQRNQWAGLSDLDDIHAGLKVLSEYHCVQVIKTESGDKGGRPSEFILINPGVMK